MRSSAHPFVLFGPSAASAAADRSPPTMVSRRVRGGPGLDRQVIVVKADDSAATGLRAARRMGRLAMPAGRAWPTSRNSRRSRPGTDAWVIGRSGFDDAEMVGPRQGLRCPEVRPADRLLTIFNRGGINRRAFAESSLDNQHVLGGFPANSAASNRPSSSGVGEAHIDVLELLLVPAQLTAPLVANLPGRGLATSHAIRAGATQSRSRRPALNSSRYRSSM